MAFDKLQVKEEHVRISTQIDSILYGKLEIIADKQHYDTDVIRLIRAAIEQLIESKKIKVYEIKGGTTDHTIEISKTLVKELQELKKKYRISRQKLINIAVNNAIEEYEAEFGEIKYPVD